MASKSIGEVAYRRPLAACSMEELASHAITARPSSGVMFARNGEGEEKNAARRLILNELVRDNFPDGMSILTMPGINWTFERELLSLREGDWQNKKSPRRTYLTCIENDRLIYPAALLGMPGMLQLGSVTQVLSPTDFAETVVRNSWIGRYFFANVDDFIAQAEHPFDVAWLDYTGPLSIQRLANIARFYERCVRVLLVVTSLKARWNRETSNAIARHGGHAAWVREHLRGEVIHDIEYQDTSPMSQIAICKV